MMLYLHFSVTYRLQNQKKRNNIFQDSNQYLSTLHNGFQQCSHCNHTMLVNSNCTSRLMHVSFNMLGTISQILKKHMQHQSQEFCGTCNVPLNKKLHFSETHKIYAVDVTDGNITISKTVNSQGSVCAATLRLKGLVSHSSYHFTCWIIDESDNIWFHDGTSTGRTSTHDGKFGTISQPNLKVCRNKEYAL